MTAGQVWWMVCTVVVAVIVVVNDVVLRLLTISQTASFSMQLFCTGHGSPGPPLDRKVLVLSSLPV